MRSREKVFGFNVVSSHVRNERRYLCVHKGLGMSKDGRWWCRAGHSKTFLTLGSQAHSLAGDHGQSSARAEPPLCGTRG